MEHVTDRHLVLFMALSTPRWGARFRREPAPEAPDVEPSAREREIVRLVALGASGPEIADEQAVRELLERRGYGVVGEAAGAASALAEAARVRPDTVLLDVHLPDKSGLDVCTALCSARPAPAVLLVSMYECRDRSDMSRLRRVRIRPEARARYHGSGRVLADRHASPGPI